MWQDMRDKVDFRNEILALSMIEHLNLVRLYGYLEQGDEQIILVEYVSNGTLREHLDGMEQLLFTLTPKDNSHWNQGKQKNVLTALETVKVTN